jgi:hypothetical protein
MNKVFSDDAVIITGKVIRTRPNDFGNSNTKVVYNRQTKKEYLTNLKRAFLRNKYIDVKFSEIGGGDADGGCPGITQSQNNPIIMVCAYIRSGSQATIVTRVTYSCFGTLPMKTSL